MPSWLGPVLLGILFGVACGVWAAWRLAARRMASRLAALEADHDLLRVVAEGAPSVILSYRLAPDGTWSYPFATERVKDVYGVPLEELTAERVGRAVHPDDLPALGRAVRESAESLQPWTATFRVRHPERGELLIEGQAVPRRDPDGGTTWHGTLTDVTDRRQAQADLSAREQLLAEMGEIAHVGGWEFNLQTGKGQWTSEVGPMFGLPRGVASNPDRAMRLFSPESRARLASALSRAAEGHPYDLDLQLTTPDGETRWVRTIGRPVETTRPVTRIRGALLDITEQKRHEAARQERIALQAQLARLAESAPGVMYAYRLEPDGRTSFPFASEALEALFAVPRERLVADGTAAFERLHPDDLARMRGGVARSARALSMWHEDFRVRHPERGTIWIEGRAAPTREPDGAVVWHGFFLDVTEQRALEEQFRQSQKMEAIGQLAGGVAHDFNNLLTVILGNATLLTEQTLAEGPLQEAREIARAADRAAALTRQLLLFSRRQVMHPVHLDINEVLGDMTRLLQRILGEDVALQATFAPGLPPVFADPGMLEQVLLNLAVNSRDAMPAGGTLAISTSLRMVEPAIDAADVEQGPRVVVTVRDTGIGMTPEVRARIFEPFFTTKEPGKGTGLGLATVYGIVRQHGGAIDVSSAVGMGSTFDIILPVSSGAVKREAAPAPRVPAPRADATVLIVEDEPSVRLLTAAVLEQAGYRVLTAGTGRAALDLWEVERATVDVLLTDIVMPDGMTGPDLARRVLVDDPQLPVIFVSGYSPESTAAGLSLQDGFNYLQKPYQLEALSRMVAEAVARRRSGQASGGTPAPSSPLPSPPDA